MKGYFHNIHKMYLNHLSQQEMVSWEYWVHKQNTWVQYMWQCVYVRCVSWICPTCCVSNINSFRPRTNGRHIADDIFKCIPLNENVWIPIKISLKCPIINILALVQIIAWCWPGDKPLSEPMIVSLLTHICVTRPRWVNSFVPESCGSDFRSIIFQTNYME